jgi:hypothetical protein
MLQGEGTLISKMLALAYLHADLLLLADLLADPTVPLDVVSAAIGPWLELVPTDEWKIGKVFASEFRFQADLFQLVGSNPEYMFVSPEDSPTLRGRWSNSFRSLFYLPQATMNAQAKRLLALQALSDADPAGLQQRAKVFIDELNASTSFAFPRLARNPIGKILLQIGLSSYSEYPLRAFDVGAMQRAVVLAYQLRAEGIAHVDVPAFMKAHPEWALHPVGPTPMQLDADTKEIRVPQQAKERPERRYGVRVVRPSL